MTKMNLPTKAQIKNYRWLFIDKITSPQFYTLQKSIDYLGNMGKTIPTLVFNDPTGETEYVYVSMWKLKGLSEITAKIGDEQEDWIGKTFLIVNENGFAKITLQSENIA